MKNYFNYFLFILVTVNSLTTFAQSPEVVVVVSQKSNLSTISPAELKLIYYKKIRQLSDGVYVEPRDQADGKVKAAFYQSYFGRGSDEIKNFWTIQVFRGREGPPTYVGSENDQAMINWLEKNPNAIGYVDKNLVGPTVKVLAIK